MDFCNSIGEKERTIITVPGVEHVADEVVGESDLRFRDGASLAIELRHHHWQSFGLLLGRLVVVGELNLKKKEERERIKMKVED